LSNLVDGRGQDLVCTMAIRIAAARDRVKACLCAAVAVGPPGRSLGALTEWEFNVLYGR